jgi:hypothetical protein
MSGIRMKAMVALTVVGIGLYVEFASIFTMGSSDSNAVTQTQATTTQPPDDPCKNPQNNSDTGRDDTVFDSYDDALRSAREKAGDMTATDGLTLEQMFDPNTGTLIGEQLVNGKGIPTKGWRIDNNHANWWDWTSGKKGKGGKFGHQCYPDSQSGPHSQYNGYAPWE